MIQNKIYYSIDDYLKEHAGNNFAEKLKGMLDRDKTLRPGDGEVYLVHVRHDDWCQLYRYGNGRCNCDPEVEVQIFR